MKFKVGDIITGIGNSRDGTNYPYGITNNYCIVKVIEIINSSNIKVEIYKLLDNHYRKDLEVLEIGKVHAVQSKYFKLINKRKSNLPLWF